MIGAERQRRGRIQPLDQPGLFRQQRVVILFLERFAELAMKFVINHRVQHQLQGGQVVQFHLIDQIGGSVDVLLPVRLTAQAENDGGGDFQPGLFGLGQTRDHRFRRRALGDALEQVR